MKKLKCIALTLLKWLGFFSLMRYITRDGVRILCYHGIWLGDEGYPGDALFMKQKTFKLRMDSLRKWNFPTVSLNQAVAGLLGEKLPSCPVAVTIDDGWYSTYAVMWPILKKQEIPATLYCDSAHLMKRKPIPHVAARYVRILAESGFTGRAFTSELYQSRLYKSAISNTGDVEERLSIVKQLADIVSIDIDRYFENKTFNYMLPEQLTEAFSEGLDVQLHTHNHLMHGCNAEKVCTEIEENRDHLSRLLGAKPEHFKHFCYPSGQTSTDIGGILAGMGIISSTTTEQSIAHPGINIQFLPRLMDGEHLTMIEFEAELCGVMDFLRKLASKTHI